MDRLELVIAVSDVMLNRYGTKDKRKKKLTAKYGGKGAQEIQKEVDVCVSNKAEAKYIAVACIAGHYGRGEARRKALGRRYTAAQDRIDYIYSMRGKSVTSAANLVISGMFDKDSVCKLLLEFCGYDAEKVQAEADRILRAKSSARFCVYPIWFFEDDESLYGDCTAVLQYADTGEVSHCVLIDTAQAAAETAQEAAEDARDEAQNLVDGITGKVEQIDSNTDRIESLEDDRYKPYPTDTASGSIASFPDGAGGIPLKSCIVQIEPVQEGSGDPSPDNVRPITGWTAAKVTRCGKNLFDANTVWSAFLQPDGTFYHPLGNTLFYIPQELVGKQLTFFSYAKADAQKANLRVCAVINGTNNNGNLINDTTGFSLTKLTFTPTSTSDYIKLENSGINGIYKDVQLELGSTATDYVPYSGQTYPITFPTEAGTVYWGYVDVLNGELVVDRAQIASYNGETLPSTWISDRDVYTSGTTPTIGAQVVYKLETPIHYPITSNQINSLYGQNNLWADTGDVSVEYRADVTKYIDRKITEAVSALT